jgi:hypothetical protein
MVFIDIGTKVSTSPDTGKVWLDRNLGARQVCTSSTDAACYGDLYQWGRAKDGHESRTSGTTETLVASSWDSQEAGEGFSIRSSSYPAYR